MIRRAAVILLLSISGAATSEAQYELKVEDTAQVYFERILVTFPTNAKSVLDCITPMGATARVSGNEIILEITDPAFVALIRERQPHAIVRHIFEPGGRFRVNHIGIRYRWLPYATPP
jgi:hypothetical protein